MKTQTLQDLKAGDKVILIKRSGQREVREIRSVSGSLIDIGRYKSAYHFGRESGMDFSTSGDTITPATPELIAEVEAETAEYRRLVLEEQARIKADPRTPLVRRFKAGDFEPWEKLSLEQLQQIKTWLDEVR